MRSSILIALLPAMALAMPQPMPQDDGSDVLSLLSLTLDIEPTDDGAAPLQTSAVADATVTDAPTTDAPTTDAPAATAAGAALCTALSGVSSQACELVANGFNSAAADVIAPVLASTALFESVAAALATNADFLVAAAMGGLDPSKLNPSAISYIESKITLVPAGPARDAISSVFAEGLRIQATATGPVAPLVTGTGSNGTSSTNGTVSTGGSSGLPPSPPSGTSGSSGASANATSTNGVPRQTGFALAAAAVAGVAGLAIGL